VRERSMSALDDCKHKHGTEAIYEHIVQHMGDDREHGKQTESYPRLHACFVPHHAR
jgi:hypothetical protein